MMNSGEYLHRLHRKRMELYAASLLHDGQRLHFSSSSFTTALGLTGSSYRLRQRPLINQTHFFKRGFKLVRVGSSQDGWVRRMMRRFVPRIVAIPRQDYVFAGDTPVYGYGSSTYSYEVPFGAFVRAPVGFSFSFRQLPYDHLSGIHQDYYDWLMAASVGLTSLIPNFYTHSVDIQSDTIGSLEAFILAALARIDPNNVDAIRQLSTSTVWQAAAQYSSLVHPDLYPYLFRISWSWPSNPRPKYVPVSMEDDRSIIMALQKMRETLSSQTMADLSAVVAEAKVDLADRLIPAVQETLLLAIAAKIQYELRKAINVMSRQVSTEVGQIARWRKRFQLLSPELLSFLQRSRFSGSDLFVPLSSKPIATRPYPVAVGWLPTGEIDYSPWIGRTRPAARSPSYTIVPAQTEGTLLPVGTRITPAASTIPLVPQGVIYDPTYYSATGEPTPGRPIIAPRPALVTNNQATLIGGSRRLFGFDPDKRPKKVGGCAP